MASATSRRWNRRKDSTSTSTARLTEKSTRYGGQSTATLPWLKRISSASPTAELRMSRIHTSQRIVPPYSVEVSRATRAERTAASVSPSDGSSIAIELERSCSIIASLADTLRSSTWK